MLQNQKFFEWFGAIMGLTGALLLALKIDISGYGFLFYLVSNIAWFVFAIRSKLYGLLTQQIGFTFASVLGLVIWLG